MIDRMILTYIFFCFQCYSVQSPDFSQWTQCDACVEAGFGWSFKKLRCGGFANRQCRLPISSNSSNDTVVKPAKQLLAVQYMTADELEADINFAAGAAPFVLVPSGDQALQNWSMQRIASIFAQANVSAAAAVALYHQ